MSKYECPEWHGLECVNAKFLKAQEYCGALVKWVEDHPSASFNEYVKARDELRKQFGVEFLEQWRKITK